MHTVYAPSQVTWKIPDIPKPGEFHTYLSLEASTETSLDFSGSANSSYSLIFADLRPNKHILDPGSFYMLSPDPGYYLLEP